MYIGDRIRELRTEKGYSQVEMAERVHVSKQTWYKYENNIVTNIPYDKIEAIAARQIYVHVTKKLEEKWNSQLKEVSILR